MNFFKVLGIIFGLVALLKPVYMHLIPWDENKFLEKFYGQKRSNLIVIISVIGLALVVFTWYKHFTTDIPYSIVLTLLFSLTAIKAIKLLFNYQQFHSWVAKLLRKDKGRDIVLIDIGAGVFGLAVLLLALFVY
ncbi:MAG: hypothetical protein SCK28_01185 [Bacillota bacterium]|nr:hypothetical protein [Bacillota bacterium]